MTVEDLIRGGRRLNDETLIDRCVVRRQSTGQPVIDPVTLVLTPPTPTSVYSGRCRIKRPTQVERERIFGDTNVSATRLVVNLPYTARPAIGDVFEATKSVDPDLVGRELRIVVVAYTTTLMFRQIGVEATTETST